MANKKYELSKLPFGYKDLEPYMSEEQLKFHHDKHHLAYVNGANADIDKFEKARKENADLDMKATLKDFSFQLGGITLHDTFWWNLAPAGRGGGGQPQGMLGDAIKNEYGSFERFKTEFTKAAVTCEGSGWAVMTYCDGTDRIAIMQVEKHNCNFPPGYPALMVLDVWEHAYYLDYKNDRAKYVEAFWNIVNWKAVDEYFSRVYEFYKKPQPAISR